MARKTSTLPATAVEPELRQALAQIAVADDVSLGHVIRQACAAYVQSRTAPASDRAQPRRTPKAAVPEHRGAESASDIVAGIFKNR